MSELSIQGSGLGGSLTALLMCNDIQAGSSPSYELCKTIYVSHPLGAKMAEAPISMAQSQKRAITIQDAPEEVGKEFEKTWEALGVDSTIHNVASLSRVYGLAVVVIGAEGVPSKEPLDMRKIWDQKIYFNVLDPLNTAGSLVLSQVPTAPDFNKPVTVRTSGETFHPSRFEVLMNEHPVYLEYTGSAFGFVGRSVYQRALFPLKSFIRSMIADDMIATKLGLIVAKQKQPASLVTQAMQSIAGVKRSLLKQAQTGQVISIDITEFLETLNMQNVDGAGAYSRTNILKNVATAADMPAKLLENETMVGGMAEGTEDAKNISGYIDRVRELMQKVYVWFDNIVQYRAWSPQFYERIKAKYPDKYSNIEYADALSEWRDNFVAEWPSLIREPESEQIKVEEVKLEAVVAFVNTFLPQLDAPNKASLLQWAADCIGENKRLFPHELVLDWEALAEHQDNEQEKEQETHNAEMEGNNFRLDAVNMDRLKSAVARLPDRKRKGA